MSVKPAQKVSELNFETYHARQRHEVTPQGLRARATNIRATDKFRSHHGIWEKLPYPGYAVVSMLNDSSENESLTGELENLQKLLAAKLNDANKYYLLPADSFHQTIANTLSGERFKKHVIARGIENQFPGIIAQAFEKIQLNRSEGPVEMKLAGVGIFGSALGILGTFSRKEDFETIIRFREQFYSNPDLNRIDIRRTRPFIGHVTLMYVDGDFNEEEKFQLGEICAYVNKTLESRSLIFKITKAELRSYQDLSAFERQPHYPVYSFLK